MSLYKSFKSPFYQYDFVINGRRFHGSTKVRNRKEAEIILRELKRKAKSDVEEAKRSGNGPLTLDIAAGRYWLEKGQHHRGSKDTWSNLNRLLEFFGPHRRLDEITDADVAALVAWRKSQDAKGRKKQVSNSTVNRSTTMMLKALFTRAKTVWRYNFPQEPCWREHMLSEPTERVRELHDYENDALEGAIRDDYAPWLEFARITGLRLAETLIRWSDVNWEAGQIRTLGKGGRYVTTPITDEVRAILEPLRGHHPEFVFTYVCVKPRKGVAKGQARIKGKRYPITYSGAKMAWRRAREKAAVTDLRFHDLRHDVATKLLRATGDLKLVQRTLNHSDIKVTARYAHVLDQDVAEALNLLAKSRKKSRKALQLVA